MSCVAEMKQILKRIDIPDKDGIRGNITLVTKVDGASVTWKSSNPEVITDKEERKIKMLC